MPDICNVYKEQYIEIKQQIDDYSKTIKYINKFRDKKIEYDIILDISSLIKQKPPFYNFSDININYSPTPQPTPQPTQPPNTCNSICCKKNCNSIIKYCSNAKEQCCFPFIYTISNCDLCITSACASNNNIYY